MVLRNLELHARNDDDDDGSSWVEYRMLSTDPSIRLLPIAANELQKGALYMPSS